jgi:hypothetical protein
MILRANVIAIDDGFHTADRLKAHACEEVGISIDSSRVAGLYELAMRVLTNSA